MGNPQFRFNPKTLRYERVRFSLWRTIITVASYGAFGFLFFVGLNLLQNILIESKLEKSLANENQALKEYKTVLASQLSQSNVLLAELKTEETQLNEKLFEVPAETTTAVAKNVNQLIAFGDGSFDRQVSAIGNYLCALNAKAKRYNQFFGERLQIKKTDVPGLIGLPSIAPVKNLKEENLVSGLVCESILFIKETTTTMELTLVYRKVPRCSQPAMDEYLISAIATLKQASEVTSRSTMVMV